MEPLKTEAISRRTIFNGLVTAATRSWRHGIQSNGHNSNAMVFPTISTSVNNSPTCRTPAADSTNMTEDQRRRLQQQRHQDHRRNVLWYGGDDLQQQHQQRQTPALVFELNNRYQSPDDWEKEPLRQRQRNSQQLQHQQNYKKRSTLPTSPIIWAVILQTVYSAAMAAVYYMYGVTSGSGWIWLRDIDSSSLLTWLGQLPPMWYFVGQAFCAATIGYILYQWQRRQRWCCYMLIALFTTALLPSVPLAEMFWDKNVNKMTEHPMENSTERRKQLLQPFNNYSEDFYENQLALYEGLWHVSFFIFAAYCLILPTIDDGHSDNEDSETVNEHQNNDKKNTEHNIKDDSHISIAVLLFAIVASIGHTTLNLYSTYQQNKHRVNSSTPSMATIQQVYISKIRFFLIYVAWM